MSAPTVRPSGRSGFGSSTPGFPDSVPGICPALPSPPGSVPSGVCARPSVCSVPGVSVTSSTPTSWRS